MQPTTSPITISTVATNVINMVKKAIGNSPTGVSFFSIKNYTNKHGEVSNQIINVGASYEKMKQKDIETLRNMDILKMQWKSAMVDIEIARAALIEAFITPDKARSDGQKDAYTNIANGIRVHNETGKLYLFGYKLRKTVLVEGEYPTVNSRKETIAKDELRKYLRTNKFVNFGLEVGNELTANGNTIEL